MQHLADPFGTYTKEWAKAQKDAAVEAARARCLDLSATAKELMPIVRQEAREGGWGLDEGQLKSAVASRLEMDRPGCFEHPDGTANDLYREVCAAVEASMEWWRATA